MVGWQGGEGCLPCQCSAVCALMRVVSAAEIENPNQPGQHSMRPVEEQQLVHTCYLVAYCLPLGAEIKRNKRDSATHTSLPTPQSAGRPGMQQTKPPTRSTTTRAGPFPPGTRPAPAKSCGSRQVPALGARWAPPWRALGTCGATPQSLVTAPPHWRNPAQPIG